MIHALPWIVIAIVVIVFFDGVLFMPFVLLLALVALNEFYRMYKRMRPIVLAGVIGTTAVIVAAKYGTQYQMVLMLALTIPITFLLAAARGVRRYVTVSMAITMFGVSWIGVAVAHAVLLRDLPHGAGLLVDVLIGTFIGDSAAYFGGRWWGMRPLAPKISPNKTVEGLIAGFIGGTLAFWLAGLYQDWLSGLDALAIGAVVAAVAPLGDLFESLVKRDAAVKDTGRVFGEHGGVLDRLDAAMFTVVAGYYMAVALL